MEHYESLGLAIGAVIKTRRLKENMGKQQLANYAVVSPKVIGLIESGQVSPSLRSLVGICRALEIPISTLMLEAEQLMPVDQDE